VGFGEIGALGKEKERLIWTGKKGLNCLVKSVNSRRRGSVPVIKRELQSRGFKMGNEIRILDRRGREM